MRHIEIFASPRPDSFWCANIHMGVGVISMVHPRFRGIEVNVTLIKTSGALNDSNIARVILFLSASYHQMHPLKARTKLLSLKFSQYGSIIVT